MRKISLFLMAAFLASAVFADGPHAFPVPFTPGKDPSHTKISFTNLPGSGSIRVYAIDGRIVADLAIAPGQLTYDWPVTNKSGEKVATGVYIFKIGGDTGKLVVIR